jgi:hypothetical protein
MLSLLCNVNFNENDEFRDSKCYQDLFNNEFLKIISENENFHKTIDSLKTIFNESQNEDDINKLIKSNMNSYMETNKKNCINLAISSLQSFVQMNWLGPSPLQSSKLPMTLIQDRLYENEPSNRVFNLIDHFKPISEV